MLSISGPLLIFDLGGFTDRIKDQLSTIARSASQGSTAQLLGWGGGALSWVLRRSSMMAAVSSLSAAEMRSTELMTYLGAELTPDGYSSPSWAAVTSGSSHMDVDSAPGPAHHRGERFRYERTSHDTAVKNMLLCMSRLTVNILHSKLYMVPRR